MAKAGKKPKPRTRKSASVSRQQLQGQDRKAKFRKSSGTNEVDNPLLTPTVGDTVTFENDLKVAVAIVLFEPTIGLTNLDGTPAGDEVAPGTGIRVIVLSPKVNGKGGIAGPFGTAAQPSTDVKIFYMVLVDPNDHSNNIGHTGPHGVGGQDPEIIISG
jgi:hypothetical protein